MRGSVGSQMTHVFNSSGINQIGESKFEAKNEATETLKEQGLGATSENIATLTGIHSYGTAETYLDRWVECGKFAREEFGIKNMEALTSEHIKAFLESKVEAGVAYSTFQVSAAALEKLENALNMYAENKHTGQEYAFRASISEMRDIASEQLSKFTGDRTYSDPQSLISALTSDNHRLAASIQHEAGVRVHEASKITSGQLRGLTTDMHTGKVVGQFVFEGKGGKFNVGNLSPETYGKLSQHVAEKGEFRLDKEAYRNDIKNASDASGQKYNSTHGLRWNFARERVAELQNNGKSNLEAKGIVSHEMGHNRVSITEHYAAK